MQQRRKNILMTGGHAATTALAVIEEIKRTESLRDIQIYFVGSRYAMEGLDIETLEYKTLTKIGVNFYPIVTGRLQTKFTRYTLFSLIKIPIGFVHAFFILLKIKPRLVLTFGGFASFPVVFWSFLFGIPVVMQEQTIAAGRAAIFSAVFARKILLARSESLKYFPKDKCVVTGNPIMREVLNIKPVGKHSPESILFMGGSRGSSFVNKLAMAIIPELIKKYHVIHITGDKDFPEVVKFKSALSKATSDNYEVVSGATPFEMGRFYGQIDLVVGRAGANTVSEVLYLKKPAIFIPLGLSFADEQTKNAMYSKEFGIGRVISEKDATPVRVASEISDVFSDYQSIIERVESKSSPDLDAPQKIVAILKEYL